jgi:uncharacterized protein YrrD
MLRKFSDLIGYKIHATDDFIGKADDFIFDKRSWIIRYLVVDTRVLFGKHVLLYTEAIDRPDWKHQEFLMNVTKEQVKNSPELDLQNPISPKDQRRLHTYYQWPGYMVPPFPVPAAGFPLPVQQEPLSESEFPPQEEDNHHLHSLKTIKGYHLQTTDDELGHVDDFLIEDQQWVVRYLVIDTRNWLPGKHVLIAPEWTSYIAWEDHKVAVKFSKEAIKESPEYDPATAVTREYETLLYKFYGMPPYWA